MEGSGEAMKRKVLKQKAVDVQKLFLAISDELGTKACIFMVDDKGNINCKSSLAAPGFHLLLENNVVKTLLTTHVTAGSGSSELMMTVDNSMRSDKSKTEFIRSIVYDLQLRRDPRRGETPIIPRSRFDQNRSLETSRMNKEQLTTVLSAYAKKEDMRMHRSVREWLELKHGLPLRNSMSPPESFCTLAVSNKLASFTKPRRADDGRRRDNADDSKMTAWRKRGASNLNTKKNQNNPSSQQQLHDEDNDDDANMDGRDYELPVDDDDVEEQLGLGQGSSEEEEVDEEDEQQKDNKQKNDGQKDDDDAQKDEQKDDEEEEEEKKEVDIDDDEDDFSIDDHRALGPSPIYS